MPLNEHLYTYLFETPDELDFDNKQALLNVWNFFHFNCI